MFILNIPQRSTSLDWSQDEQAFFTENKEIDAQRFIQLHHKQIPSRLLHQLKAIKIAAKKFPFLIKNPLVVYPPTLNLEQSSSAATAAFKASLFHGEKFIDLSAGFGIDAYFFAQQFTFGIVLEKNRELAEILSHNYCLLGIKNIQIGVGIDSHEFIQTNHEPCDLIYIDPARRNGAGHKMVAFSDCEPQILDLLPKLLSISSTILIKSSPLLDIQAACMQLGNVKNVYVIAVDNECKELLFHVERAYQASYEIHAIHLSKDNKQTFSFNSMEEKVALPNIGDIKKYLYEPNAAILKSGGFKSLSKIFKVHKLHPNTHLYCSNVCITDFPGRCFEVVHCGKVDQKLIKTFIPDMKANLSIRNFPGSVESLKTKLGIKDGGEHYIFASTNAENKKVILITKKLEPLQSTI